MAEEESLKDRLISKAIDVFSLKGYAAANLTDVTEVVGVSRGPIYYHFKDKLGLYRAAFDLWETSIRTSHGAILAQANKPIIQILGETILNCMDIYLKFRPYFFVGIETLEELEPLRRRYYALIQDIYDDKIVAVRKAMDQGSLGRSLAPELIVDTVYVIYDGIRVGLERPGRALDPRHLRTIVDRQMSVLEQSVGPSRPT